MRAVLQRVLRAAVRVEGRTVGQIGPGLAILLGVVKGDTIRDADRLAERTARLRVFHDERGRMNRSLLEERGAALVISQFTLAGDTRRGHRPSFDDAAPPETAETLYEEYAAALRRRGIQVATGRFRAMMEVEIIGDGPVTILMEEPKAG
jgi:D-tyrosyl-tRNA(Tyr) deacylase